MMGVAAPTMEVVGGLSTKVIVKESPVEVVVLVVVVVPVEVVPVEVVVVPVVPVVVVDEELLMVMVPVQSGFTV
jgi:hypothetical protein